jgi:two-component system chemotaxis sensor kinase CheA
VKSKESEYKELFLGEASENFEELNRLFIDLEKDHKNKRAINSIFRITHTLKGNAMGMGFKAIAELAHVMEDVMGAIKSGDVEMNPDFFEALFRANDKLGGLINALETGAKVSYLGIKTKLEILLKNDRVTNDESDDSTVDASVEHSDEEIALLAAVHHCRDANCGMAFGRRCGPDDAGVFRCSGSATAGRARFQ